MKRLKTSTKMLLALTFLVILRWAAFAGEVYTFVKFNDGLSYFLDWVGIFLSYIALPIMTIVFVISLIARKGKSFILFRIIMKTFIIVLTLFLLLLQSSQMDIMYDCMRQSTKITSIYSKSVENGKYYFTVLHSARQIVGLHNENDSNENGIIEVKIECSEEMYNDIIVDSRVEYVVGFRAIGLRPKKGYLEEFDTSHFADNRNKKPLPE